MSEHLSKLQVEQYSKRAMSPMELLDAGDHLVVCESCRGRVAETEVASAALSSLREDFREQARTPLEHLTYEQLESYVDDRLDDADREIVESHTVVCRACKEEMRDLFAFKETLGAEPATVARGTAPGATVGEKLLAWWRRPQWKIAGAMAAIVLLALAAWLTLRARRADRQLAELHPMPSPTASLSPTVSPTPEPTQGQSNNQTPTPTPGVTPTPLSTPAPTPIVRPTAPTTENPGTAEPVLALNDGGGRVTLDRGGNLEGLESMSPSERQAVRVALLNERLEPSASLAEVRGKSGTLMGGGQEEAESFAVVGPTGTVVATPRPTFRWRALKGATSYSVKVYDTDFNLMASSGALTGTEWAPTQGALAPGKVYVWQVAATKEGQEVVSPAPPAPEARFKVIDNARAEGLNRSLAAAGNSHLARGVLYARAGLLDEAESELETLLKANPQSRAARKLLLSVRAMRSSKQ